MADKFFPTADQILAANDLPYKDVPTPEWGEGAHVRVKSLMGNERDAFEQAMVEAREGSTREGLTARLVAMAAIHPDTGKALFSLEQVAALGQKSARALNRCYASAAKLAGFGREDMEDLLGNSGSGRSAASTSVSPVSLAAPSANCSPAATAAN